jgi:hypothetical protein
MTAGACKAGAAASLWPRRSSKPPSETNAIQDGYVTPRSRRSPSGVAMIALAGLECDRAGVAADTNVGKRLAQS